MSFTAVWSSWQVIVDFLLYLASLNESWVSLSKMSLIKMFMILMALLEILMSGWTCFNFLFDWALRYWVNGGIFGEVERQILGVVGENKVFDFCVGSGCDAWVKMAVWGIWEWIVERRSGCGWDIVGRRR
ncbi:hypothetical protein ACFX2G_029953 [Malus domestica]